MKLKESSHLLADVLYAEGVDVYKRSEAEMKDLEPKIADTKLRIDAVLREHFQTGFSDLDGLPPKRLQEIRKSFLGHYRGSVDNGEKLKKWVPLNQLVGYVEVLVASAYLQLNIEIDADLEKLFPKHCPDLVPLEHVRIKILNAFKKINQGKTWKEVKKEVASYLFGISVNRCNALFKNWRTTFESINHPLQALYAEHTETMQINDAIYDLQFKEQKRSAIIQKLVGAARRSWKPANMEHDIHSQSTEVNRSLIELTCNAIDANTEGENRVEVSINNSGYSVRDHGTGMNPYVILEKLMIPKVSGKTGKETIGRFGVGFYTALSHLKKKNDVVRIETHDGKIGHVIEFKVHERTGDVFVHTERNDNLEKGTNITVKAESFDPQDAERLCRELLEYNDRSAIIVNGEKINREVGLERIKGAQTCVKYSTEIGDKSKVSIMVNGVVVETIHVTGMNMCKEIAIDLPLTCSIPESRSVLSMDQVAIDSMKEAIDSILSSQIDEQSKIAICNALYPVLEKMQARSRSNKRDDNLITYLQKSFEDSIEMEGKVFLPNTAAFKALDIPNAVYLDSHVMVTDLEKIPGVSNCDRFESTAGNQLFIADFKEGATDFVVEDGNRLVIDRKIYERHKDSPAALNVYFSNLDTTKQSKKEKAKGRILLEPKKREAAEATQDEGETIRRETIRMMGNFGIDGMSEDQIYAFANLSEKQQMDRIVEIVRGQIRILERSHDPDMARDMTAKVHPEKPRIAIVVDNMLQSTDISQWDEEIKKIEDTEWANIVIGAYDLRKVVPAAKLVKKHHELIGTLWRWKEAFTKDNPRNYVSLVYQGAFLKDFLRDLDLFYDVSELTKEFAEYSEEVMHNFLSFIRNIEMYVPMENRKAIFMRAKRLFLLKIAKLSLPEQKNIIGAFPEFQTNGKNPVDLVLKGQYQRIPRSVRGMAMYMVEGGEILSEQNADESSVEQREYQTQIPLSTLVQAKKDNEQFFQGFSGTPAELVAQAGESQKGVDPSKAMRDIMHSAENQIVNDGYLWIREILQNSLDAVRQNRGEFREAPKVAINAYKLSRAKEVHEAQLWDIFHSAITRYYPAHFHYFKNAITAHLPKLTSKNFLEAVDILGTLNNGGQPYFSEGLLRNLKSQFESMAFNEPELVVEVSDPVGMDLHTVINYLLIPNESSKGDDDDPVGKFGQGFFTIFGDAKEVLIKTSKGDFKTQYIKIRPIKDHNGKVIDFSVEMSCKSERFKGTVIQKVVDTDIPEVEAAFCKSAVVSYGGLIDRKAVQLDFRDQEINTPRTILAETEIPGIGMMRMYDAHENAMTQNGLFIKELDEELMALIPENLRKVMRKNGIVLDIPASVKLIKSRADIARKKEIMPLLAKYLPALALRSYLSTVMLGKAELPNLPFDYFEAKLHRRVEQSIRSDSEKIVRGESLLNYERYLKDENALTQLLTLLPCVNMGGKSISIFDLADRLSKNPKSVDLAKLPQSLQDKIRYATERKSQETQDEKEAESEYGVKNTMIMRDRTLPQNPDIRKAASVYYAYDQLVRFIFEYMQASDVRPVYYLQVGQSKAHAYQGTNSIGFNLDYLEQQMPKLAEIIDRKLPATNMEVQHFLEEAVFICTHERQHNLEGSEETQWTHNDTFFKGQREVIAKFIKDKNVDIQSMLDDLYRNFTSSHIPVKELIKHM